MNKNVTRLFYFQRQIVFTAFSKQPKTMLMVSIETGIFRANICRYVAEWKKQKHIVLVRKSICSVSKHSAGFYTTNAKLISKITNKKRSYGNIKSSI